jgi:hypothetical protein
VRLTCRNSNVAGLLQQLLQLPGSFLQLLLGRGLGVAGTPCNAAEISHYSHAMAIYAWKICTRLAQTAFSTRKTFACNMLGILKRYFVYLCTLRVR